jgi:RNA polymerase primary sigma factor
MIHHYPIHSVLYLYIILNRAFLQSESERMRTQQTLLTREGYQKPEQELDALSTVLHKKGDKRLHQALSEDDILKNGEHLDSESLLTQMTERGFVTYNDVAAAFQVQEDLEKLDSLATLVGDDIDEMSEPDEDGISEEPSQADGMTDLLVCLDKIAPENMTELYFKEAGQVPLLTTEQEIALAKCMEAGRVALERLNDCPDPEEQSRLKQAVLEGQVARDHLVCANTRLVISVAKRYIGRKVPFLDLIQEGNLGLLRAANKFDYRLGIKFSTYATWWIRQGITRAIANQSRTIRIPVYVGDQISRLLRATHQLTQELGHEPTPEELAAALDTSRHKVEEILRAMDIPVSLEMPIGDEGETEFGDLVEDENATPDDEVTSATLQGLLRDMLQDLPPREARILRLRYGLMNGRMHTLEEIGKKLGVTRERARQIEAQALRRLRHPAYSRRLRYFME